MHHSAKKHRSIGVGGFVLATAGAIIALAAPAAMAGESNREDDLCEGQSFSQQFLG